MVPLGTGLASVEALTSVEVLATDLLTAFFSFFAGIVCQACGVGCYFICSANLLILSLISLFISWTKYQHQT